MSSFKKRWKRKALKKNVVIKNALHSFIQPFKEMPSIFGFEEENTDRINAYDLFAFYTADIIKKDTIFFR